MEITRERRNTTKTIMPGYFFCVKICKNLREKEGVRQTQLCKGLCSHAKYVRIEYDQQEMDFFLIDRLMGRLGKSVERLTYVLPIEVYEMYELRQEIQQKLLRENGIQTEADRILVTPGGKMAIYLAVQAVLNHGDKVLLPEPAWVSYESIVISAGAEAVKVPLSPADHYRLTEALLEQHYTPEVRLIIINYPNNPTGRILHQDEAEALSAFMQRHPDVLLLSDEVYDAIVYDGVRSISMASRPEVADRVITINGFSKFAAMTGWRMGYLTARRDIYAAIYKLYQQSVSCMSGFLQEGAVQAFRIPDEVEAMRQSYQRRRDAFVGRLNAIPGVHCQMPEGAFYAWVSFDVDMTSDEMCDYILDHAKVVGVSGAAYGMTQGCFLRFSFASDDAALSVAADRIEAAMRAYQQR